MYMEISLDQLLQFTTMAVNAGVQAYIRQTDPETDRIKQSEARRYISKMGFRPSMLRKWVDVVLLKVVKTSEQQNAAVWYSLAEIKNLISSIRLKEMCNNQDK